MEKSILKIFTDGRRLSANGCKTSNTLFRFFFPMVLLFMLAAGPNAFAQVTVNRTSSILAGASPFQDSLWTFNLNNNYSIIRRLGPTISGGTITGINGLATNPVTGEHFAVVKLSAVSGRVLVKMNVQTGVCTNIGNLGDNFSSITFNSNGTLFGVTGDGASVPETVYKINTSTAAKTLFKTLGNGADGELITYNSDDHNIYHWSGNGTVVWERFDTSGGAVQGLTYTGTPGGESFGGIYLGGNQMLVSNISSSFRIWNTSTLVIGATVASGLPDDIRGLSREDCNSSVSAPSTVICPSGTVTLTVTNGASDYQWYKDGSAIASANSSTYAASAAGVYNVIYKDQCGIADSTATGITLTTGTSVTPSVSVGASPSTTICAGTNVTFTATPTNGGATPSYQWTLNGLPVGSNSATYANAALTNGATVAVTMTTSAACPTSPTATSSTITMTVNPNVTPSVSIAASPSATECASTSISFTATPTNGGAAPTYQWKKNGSNVATGVTWNAGTSLVNGDNITVEMTSNVACPTPSATVTSNTVTRTVIPSVTPSVTIAANPGTNICPTTSVSFTATPTNGGAAPTYQWKKNGGNVATGVSWNAGTTLVNGDVVTVEMTSNAACPSPSATATSNALTMTVTGSVTPSVTVSSNVGTHVCPGTTAIFTATPTNGGSTPTYQWRKNSINVGTGSTYTTTPVAGDVIDVVMTSNASCASSTTATSAPLTITSSAVVPGVTITKTPSTPICPGTAVLFNATPTNGGPAPTYQWKVNGVNVATTSNWGSSSLNNNDVVSVTMTSSICTVPATATANTTIAVNPNTPASVTISANPGTNICSGTGVTFTATPTGGGTPTYQWKRNGVNVGTNSATYNAGTTLTNGNTIEVVMTSSATCALPKTSNSNLITMNVTTTVTPAVSISTIPSGTACVGSVLTFLANPTAPGNTPTYAWTVDNTPVGSNMSTYTDNGSLSAGNHTISVTMTSSVSQCITTTTATGNLVKAITPLVTPTVSISSTQAPGGDACVGSSVTFTSTTTNAGTTPTYQWKKNGVNVATGSSYPAGTTLATGDVITLDMASSAACASPVNVTSAPVNITVWPNVTASVTISSNPANNVGCTSLPVTFTATPVNMGSNPTYQWKKNGSNVGTNSPTYTDAGLVTGNTISCQVTTSIPCATPKPATSNTLTMTMNPVVTGSINLSVTPDSVGCEKTPFTFHTFHTNGGNNPAFKWYKNGTPIPGAAQAVYSSTTLADGDIIACELISNAVCVFPVMSPPISVDIIPSPVPTVTIAGVPDADGINFVATLTDGGQNPTFQWRKNSQDIPGATAATYKGQGLSASDKISVLAHSDLQCANPQFVLSNTLEVAKVTAINTVTTSFDELTLFPNPNGGRFTIKGTAKATANSKAIIEVLNAVGQVVYKDVAELKGHELEAEAYLGGHNASGMYMLRITVDGHTNNLRFIVKD